MTKKQINFLRAQAHIKTSTARLAQRLNACASMQALRVANKRSDAEGIDSPRAAAADALCDKFSQIEKELNKRQKLAHIKEV